MTVMRLRDQRLDRAKARMDLATREYRTVESEFIKAKREYEDAWREFMRDLEQFDRSEALAGVTGRRGEAGQ